jgi:HK97 family phage portal protein
MANINTITVNGFGDSEILSQGALAVPAFFHGVRLIAQQVNDVKRQIKRNNKNVDNHYLNYLLNAEPNEYTAASAFIEAVITNALIYGNAFIYVERDEDNNVISLKQLESGDMSIYFSGTKKSYYSSKMKLAFAQDEIIHIKNFSTNGLMGVNGSNTMYQTFEAVNSLVAIKRYSIKNGAMPGMLITTGSTAPTEVQIAAMEAAIDIKTSGPRNAGKAVFVPANTKAEAFTTSLPDTLEKLSALQIKDVALMLGIHPAYLYEDGTEALKPEIMRDDLVRATKNWANKLREGFQTLFSVAEKLAGFTVEMKVSDRTGGDAALIKEDIDQVNNGILSVNEVRASRGLAPVEGGDILRMPVAVSQPITAYLPPAKQQAPVSQEKAPEKAPEPTQDQPKEEASKKVTGEAFIALFTDIAERAKQRFTKASVNKVGPLYPKWIKDFAESQEQYVLNSFVPAIQTFTAATGNNMDIKDICSNYKQALLDNKQFDLTQEIINVLKGI